MLCNHAEPNTPHGPVKILPRMAQSCQCRYFNTLHVLRPPAWCFNNLQRWSLIVQCRPPQTTAEVTVAGPDIGSYT